MRENFLDEFKLYVHAFRCLVSLTAEAAETQRMISASTVGVSSPPIKSPEEAKYQKGTPVYLTDRAFLDMLQRDELEKKLQTILTTMRGYTAVCRRMQKAISDTALDDIELDLLGDCFFERCSYRHIAKMHFMSKVDLYVILLSIHIQWIYDFNISRFVGNQGIV